MGEDFSIKAASELVTGGPLEVAATVSAYEASLAPLSISEPDLKGDMSNRLAKALSAIGAKVSPTMTIEQGKTWQAAMMLALSNLPGRVAAKAAQEAIHVPMKFLNEAEAAIREKAEPIEARHREAIHRLRRLQEALERGGDKLLEAPEGYENGKSPPLTDEEIRDLLGSELGRKIIDMGITAQHLSRERVDAIKRDMPLVVEGDAA